VEKKTLLDAWLSQAVKEAAKGRFVRLMFQDEARFGRQSDPRKCWGPEAVRPVVKTELVREYTYAYAAVSPIDGQLVTLVLPYANTDNMNIFLKEVAARFPNDYIILVMDGASWHRSKKLEVPENIRIERLPAYSPELNPVEHIWAHLRENEFHNKCFKSIKAVEKHLASSLETLEGENTRLIKMTCWSWIRKTINLKAA
jgi:transposase